MSGRGRLTGTFLFAFMMALFEAAVVVYLRRLWELQEIDLTHATLENLLIRTEILREAASLGMIATVAWLAGRRGLERLALGAIIFGVWDIFYYIDLHFLMGWPSSPLDWDILFLIPRPWIGPVLAPSLVSVALIVCGLLLVRREDRWPVRPAGRSWILSLAGGAIVIVSFLLPTVPATATAVPTGFSWPIFGIGLALALAGFAHAYTRRPR
jgi:hypothetical protein